jgi:hypothetical protein
MDFTVLPPVVRIERRYGTKRRIPGEQESVTQDTSWYNFAKPSRWGYPLPRFFVSVDSKGGLSPMILQVFILRELQADFSEVFILKGVVELKIGSRSA